MADVGELMVRIRADTAELEQKLKNIQGITQQAAGKMTGAFGNLAAQLRQLAPVLTVAGFYAFSKGALDSAGRIQDLADRIGFAASTLSALEGPLRASGATLDDFAMSLGILNNVLGEAAKGTNQEAIKAFDALGLSVRKLLAMNEEERFYAVARALGEIGDQAKLTEAGRNLLGRGFLAMAPIIKETNGDLEEHVAKLKQVNEALSDETIKRIDDFGDALSRVAIQARNEFLETLSAILKVIDAATTFAEKYAPKPSDRAFRMAKIGLTPQEVDQANIDAWRNATGEMPTGAHTEGPLEEVVRAANRAKGSNAGLLKDTQAKEIQNKKKALEDYLEDLERQNVLLGLSSNEAAEMEARFKALDLAKEADIRLTDDQVERIGALARANEDLKDKMQEAQRFSRELHDQLAKGLADVALHFDNASDAAANFAMQLADILLQKRVTGPLADSLIGIDGRHGLLDDAIGSVSSLLGFADGGSPPVGVPSIVGERGPEIFVPKTAGTVIPNHALGGGRAVNFTQIIQVSPGVPELVRAEIGRAAPRIAAAAQAGMVRSAESGGRTSQIFGKRSG